MEHIPEFIGNHMILVTLLIAVVFFLAWNIYGDTLSGVQQVLPTVATRLMNREKATVIDVRNEEDYTGGHIINALNYPDGEVQSRGKQLEKIKSKAVILCCNSGAVSARIGRKLKMAGFEKIYSIKGGIDAWKNANLPLTRDNQ